MATQTKVIGPISAYAIAVQEGYTGSKADWAEAIGNAQANAAAAEAAADRVQELTESLPDDFTDTIANFAPTYSTSGTYNVGDYVIHYGSLYRCITKITTAEAWTPIHWTQVSVGEDLKKTVWHESQNLTQAQRTQARNNIDAADQLTVSFHTTQISNLESGKQDKLTFDSTPTAGSNNPVTSAGIKAVTDALAGDVDDLNSAVEHLESGSLSALGAENGQVPVADGNGNWMWGDHNVSVFDATKTYSVNDFVLYGGKTYKCVTAIASPKAWDPSDWVESIVADGLSQVLTWIENADETFTLNRDNLLRYTKDTQQQPWPNDEHNTILVRDDGSVYVKSDGTVRFQLQFYSNTAKLPAWFIPGQTYVLNYDGVPGIDVAIRVYIWKDGHTSDAYQTNLVWANSNTSFVVPPNTTGLSFRLQWDATGTAFETVVHPKLYLINDETEKVTYYDPDTVTVPQEVSGWQDFVNVGNHIWMFMGSENGNGYFDVLDNNWNYIKRITHNIGHCNTVSYDPDTDSLLMTNHMSTDKCLYIFNDVSAWENLSNVDYASVNKTVVDLSSIPNDMQYNSACWGEKKLDGSRFVYVASNIGQIWTKLDMTLSGGTYTGAFAVVWSIFGNRNIVNGINTSQVIQGMTYYQGYIYASISHNPFYGVKYSFTGKRAIREILHVDGTGLVEGNEGCMVMDGKVYLGCSSWDGAASAPIITKITL